MGHAQGCSNLAIAQSLAEQIQDPLLSRRELGPELGLPALFSSRGPAQACAAVAPLPRQLHEGAHQRVEPLPLGRQSRSGARLCGEQGESCFALHVRSPICSVVGSPDPSRIVVLLKCSPCIPLSAATSINVSPLWCWLTPYSAVAVCRSRSRCLSSISWSRLASIGDRGIHANPRIFRSAVFWFLRCSGFRVGAFISTADSGSSGTRCASFARQSRVATDQRLASSLKAGCQSPRWCCWSSCSDGYQDQRLWSPQ